MKNYLDVNRKAWNERTEVHFSSEFYDNQSFIAGRNSLNEIELGILGDIVGKRVLHLQCHFGQDSISMSRMGAEVTGVDLSDTSIKRAEQLAKTCEVETRFIRSDVFELPQVLNEQFDVVFTTYGTIGWLPDIERWAKVVEHFLKPGGRLVFAEFHPLVWMFDDDFTKVTYRYFYDDAIETEEGSYTENSKEMNNDYISWNHGLGEVISALRGQGLSIDDFQEFDYSPYDCFAGTEEFEPGKFRIKKFGNKLPMVYRIHALKP